MKKQHLLIQIFCLVVFINTANAQLKKVALISVYGNRALSDNPLDKVMNEKLLNDTSFNLAPFVESFCGIINDDLLKEFPFPFVPKEEVINAPGYKELAKFTGSTASGTTIDLTEGKVPLYNVAAGYIPIASFGIVDDVKAIKKAFEILPDDVDGVMIAYLSFQLVDQAGAFGITIKKVQAYANIKIFNREGKRIFKLKDWESSKGGITAIGGFVMETKKLMPHIKDASDNLFVSMKKKMVKSLAKLAKKIAKDKED